MKWLAIIVSLIITTCAHGNPVAEPPPPIPQAPAPQVTEEPTAADYLEAGMDQFNRKMYRKAVQSFRYAIKSGMLNDMGRALAYWHIGFAYQQIGKEDNAAEAYFSFIIVGQDILEADRAKDFIQGFRLKLKMKLATAYINALWTSRTKGVK